MISNNSHADDLIATHGQWSVSYNDGRDSIITITRNKEDQIFGFICNESSELECFLGSHVPALCSDSGKVNAVIQIDRVDITSWSAECENVENPKTGETDRALLTSGFGGDSVDKLLEAMRKGKQLTVAIKLESGNLVKSVFSLSGYSSAFNEMGKILGWSRSQPGGGIGGDGSADRETVTSLEKRKWKF